jgi:hypothetical protein
VHTAGSRVEEGTVGNTGCLGGGVAAVWSLGELGDCAGYGVVAAGVGGGVDLGDGGWAAGCGGVEDDGPGNGAEGLGEGGAGARVSREVVGSKRLGGTWRLYVPD